MTDEIAQEEELTKEKSKDIKTMQRTSSLLPDSDVNIQKLKVIFVCVLFPFIMESS